MRSTERKLGRRVSASKATTERQSAAKCAACGANANVPPNAKAAKRRSALRQCFGKGAARGANAMTPHERRFYKPLW